MKNSLSDVHNHLVAQLERLGDEDMDSAKLALELDRSRGIAMIASQIAENAKVVLEAQVAVSKYDLRIDNPLALLTGGK